MIKALRLGKGIVIIGLGILALIIAQIMSSNRMQGDTIVLGISGALLIIGAFILLYPILFATKAADNEKVVELKPVAKEPIEFTEEEMNTNP